MIKDSQKLKELFLSLGYSEENYKIIIIWMFTIDYIIKTIIKKRRII